MQIYTNFTKFVHRHLYLVGSLGVMFGFTFLAGGFVVANGQTLEPNDSHIVSLYVNDEEIVIPTRAKTVGEVFERANITVTEHDLVEPAADTLIEEDNFKVNVYKARPVTIIDEGASSVTRVMSPYSDTKLAVEKAGYKIYPEDKLNAITGSGDSFIKENIIGEKIVIDRATPVTVSLFGEAPVVYRTHVKTVGDLLSQRGIGVEDGAVLNPSPETPLEPHLAIFISKFGKNVVTVDEVIPFPVDNTPDPNAPLGNITVVSAGKKGQKKVTYEIETRDGVEIGRKVLQEVIVEEPVTQVQKRGTKRATVTGNKLDWMIAAGIPADQHASVDFIIGHESGWRPDARNAGGCFGLGQACPGRKLVNVCPNWQSDPVCQLGFFNGYAVGRYGSWNAAYNFWQANHWW